ncbi:hypothetical protein RRG08_016240 [Elysia crispata]|uniref:Uncharacterized protein n=1 Tax=Elysia crispata TaxID=231223 RepID=A0AAE0ZJ20_9GAST|nr:hypothetical protein RRG08_016240 [Elysia crispata]
MNAATPFRHRPYWLAIPPDPARNAERGILVLWQTLVSILPAQACTDRIGLPFRRTLPATPRGGSWYFGKPWSPYYPLRLAPTVLACHSAGPCPQRREGDLGTLANLGLPIAAQACTDRIGLPFRRTLPATPRGESWYFGKPWSPYHPPRLAPTVLACHSAGPCQQRREGDLGTLANLGLHITRSGLHRQYWLVIPPDPARNAERGILVLWQTLVSISPAQACTDRIGLPFRRTLPATPRGGSWYFGKPWSPYRCAGLHRPYWLAIPPDPARNT